MKLLYLKTFLVDFFSLTFVFEMQTVILNNDNKKVKKWIIKEF